jgi:hypothetical protein
MKCFHCEKVVRKNWSYCPYCSLFLKKRKLSKSDRILCCHCHLERARHYNLATKLIACDNFEELK